MKIKLEKNCAVGKLMELLKDTEMYNKLKQQ